jgi:hypothetical protein
LIGCISALGRLDDPRLFQKYGLTQATDRRIQIMSGTIEQLEGGCLCGAVRFIATGQPKGIYWCHCQSCRRHTGAPVAVFAVFDCEYLNLRRDDHGGDC